MFRFVGAPKALILCNIPKPEKRRVNDSFKMIVPIYAELAQGCPYDSEPRPSRTISLWSDIKLAGAVFADQAHDDQLLIVPAPPSNR